MIYVICHVALVSKCIIYLILMLCYSKLRSLNPEFQFTSIKSGIDESVIWFINNYENARK